MPRDSIVHRDVLKNALFTGLTSSVVFGALLLAGVQLTPVACGLVAGASSYLARRFMVRSNLPADS